MVVILLGYMYWDVELSPAASTTKTAGSGLEKTLVLGTDPGFKPFEYKQGQEIVGFDIDLVREIAKDTNRSLQIEEIAFDGLLPALQAGRIDLIAAGMTVTPDRRKNAEFSHTYYTAAQKIIVPKTGSTIATSDDLIGRRIGVQLGTTADTLAHKIRGRTWYNSSRQLASCKSSVVGGSTLPLWMMGQLSNTSPRTRSSLPCHATSRTRITPLLSKRVIANYSPR